MSIFSKVWKKVTKPIKKLVGKISDVLGEDVTKALAIAAAVYGGYTLASGSFGAGAATTTAGTATGTAATGAAATTGTTAAGTINISAGSTITASQAASLGISTAAETSTWSTALGYAKTAGLALSAANSVAGLVGSVQASKEAEETAQRIKEAEASAKATKAAGLWTLRRQLVQDVRRGSSKSRGSAGSSKSRGSGSTSASTNGIVLG